MTSLQSEVASNGAIDGLIAPEKADNPIDDLASAASRGDGSTKVRRQRRRRKRATIVAPVEGEEDARTTVAVVTFLDTEEPPKIVGILQELRRKGVTPILVDAELFANGTATLGRKSGRPRIQFSRSVMRAQVDTLRGELASLDNTVDPVVAQDVVIFSNRVPARILGHDVRIDSPKRTSASTLIDAVWPEGVDIQRRLQLQTLFEGITANNIPSIAPTWSAVQRVTHKHRAFVAIAEYSSHGPAASRIRQPRSILLVERQKLESSAAGDGAVLDPGGESLLRRCSVPQYSSRLIEAQIAAALSEVDDAYDPPAWWLKPIDGTHSKGVNLVDRLFGDALRDAFRTTEEGRVCLAQEDIRTVVVDVQGNPYRADASLIADRSGVLIATLRLNRNLNQPTNSFRGGFKLDVPLTELPDEFHELAVNSLYALGARYGSIDAFGGWRLGSSIRTDQGRFTVVERRGLRYGEGNLTPGGRAPGFRESVISPMIDELLVAIEHSRHGSVYLFAGRGSELSQTRENSFFPAAQPLVIPDGLEYISRSSLGGLGGLGPA